MKTTWYLNNGWDVLGSLLRFRNVFNWPEVSLMFQQQKNIVKTNIMNSDIQPWTWGPHGPHISHHYILKIPSAFRRRITSCGWGSDFLSIHLIFSYSSKFLNLSKDYRSADRRQKSSLDDVTDFLSIIWQHIKTSSFCVSFNFCFVQEAWKCL